MNLEDIDTIAVLGAGNMGHGIAEVAAITGFNVMLRDISEDIVQEGLDQIEWSLEKLVEHGQLTKEESVRAREVITPIVDLEDAVETADFIIEAVPEQMDIKREVYTEIDAVAPDHAVFASNTSSLSITELAEATGRPELVCGMHFFNPVVRMQLVEVIAGDHTDESTLELAEELAEEMGKTPIRVRKDSPGFIVNRVLAPMLNEAAWIVESGNATIAEVDSTTKYGMGMPMGAFELADHIGIDIAVDVLEYLHESLGEAYAPAPLLEEKVSAGTLGKKTDTGFYEYDNGTPEIPADQTSDRIATRLRAVMANEVAKLVEIDVAMPAEIDEAVELGAGVPTGPAKIADSHGLPELVETLNVLFDETGENRYEPADLLIQYANAGRGFYDAGALTADEGFETIRVEHKEGVGHIILDKPERMNAISTTMLDELDRARQHLEDEDGIRSILITGAGSRAFSAGADVQSMVAQQTDPIQMVEVARHGQRVFGGFEQSDLPVVAGIDGYCLGGGMELATAADLRVASAGSEFAQPEHNLGLLPGWGGTQRLKHIIGDGRAKEVIFTGDRYDAKTMAEYGFVNEVVPDGEAEQKARELAEKLASGPPIAMRYTKRAMHAGRADSAGLELEAQAFGQLMTTDDLMEGISAFMEDRDPEFTGT